MSEKPLSFWSAFKWYHWAGLTGFGLIIGLTMIIVINTRPHSGDSEERKVAAAVSKHVLLPTDETPALATVTDPTKLKNNPFLRQGQTGDKILIFAKWKQAVIYRPSADRIVDIGPVDVSPPGGDTSGYSLLK